MKTDIRPSLPHALDANFGLYNDISGSFERQAAIRGIVRGRIIMPFTV